MTFFSAFSFDESNRSRPYRTHSRTIDNAKEAMTSNNINNRRELKGVERPSAVTLVPNCDIIRGMGVDYMHCVLIVVTKLLMSLWFDGSQKNESYSVYQSLPFIEKGLVCLKPSNYTSRVPRTIKGNLGYRKASEFRSFLLHYFVPVIPQLLPPIYFEHYYLLSHAVHLLLKSNLSLFR